MNWVVFGLFLGVIWVNFGLIWFDFWLIFLNFGWVVFWFELTFGWSHWSFGLSLGGLSVLGKHTIISILPPFKIPVGSSLKVFCNGFLRSGVSKGLEKALLRMSEPWTRSDNDINMSIHAHQRVYFQRIHEYGFLLSSSWSQKHHVPQYWIYKYASAEENSYSSLKKAEQSLAHH